MIFVMLAGLRISSGFFSNSTVPVDASIRIADGVDRLTAVELMVVFLAVSSANAVLCTKTARSITAAIILYIFFLTYFIKQTSYLTYMKSMLYRFIICHFHLFS